MCNAKNTVSRTDGYDAQRYFDSTPVSPQIFGLQNRRKKTTKLNGERQGTAFVDVNATCSRTPVLEANSMGTSKLYQNCDEKKFTLLHSCSHRVTSVLAFRWKVTEHYVWLIFNCKPGSYANAAGVVSMLSV